MAYDAIYALARPYWEGCEWVEVVTKDSKVRTERTCTTALATFVFSEEDAYEPCDGSGASRTNASELEVSVPTGETWEGELEGHGADGELSAERTVDYGAGATFAFSINVDTPTCRARWSHRDDGFDEKERVAVSGSSVEVDRIAYGEACHDDQQAYVDGVLYGVVSEDTGSTTPTTPTGTAAPRPATVTTPTPRATPPSRTSSTTASTRTATASTPATRTPPRTPPPTPRPSPASALRTKTRRPRRPRRAKAAPPPPRG